MTTKQQVFETMVLVFMVTVLVAGFGTLYVMQRNVDRVVDPIEECISNISPDVDRLEWQYQWQECQFGVSP